MNKLTVNLKKIAPSFPIWTAQMAKPPVLEWNKNDSVTAEIVYFPSCISRMMGTYPDKQKNSMETFYSICAKSKIGVKTLSDANNSCCGQIFSSKGFHKTFAESSNKLVERLWKNTLQGKLPVVIDVSSCAYTLHGLAAVLNNENKKRFAKLKIMDSVDFLHDLVLPKVTPTRLKESIVLHSVCSLQKLKTENKFIGIANKFAKKVTLPINSGCCGMAGDRGFLFPELTNSATKLESDELKSQEFEGYYSSTKTCEMAMTQAVNKNYESILYLIDEGL